jgi:hypothetical protein
MYTKDHMCPTNPFWSVSRNIKRKRKDIKLVATYQENLHAGFLLKICNYI